MYGRFGQRFFYQSTKIAKNFAFLSDIVACNLLVCVIKTVVI